ncbi:MAG: aldo/keto reductase, partial [Pseudorhodobacter sp.]|nr:aldo/keto reductase [Pseudorhodobacter sp.]
MDNARRFTFPGSSLSVNRMGYGAMQLAGKGVFGPPRDPDEARAVLLEAVASGIDHIDTSDFYGPHVTNHLIRQALHPYPANLVIVTKVGAYRDDKGGWIHDLSPDFLGRSVEDNLVHLGLTRMAVVNLRIAG